MHIIYLWWFQSKIAPSAQEEVKNKTCLQQKHASKCLTLRITCWNSFNPLIKQNFWIYFWHISGISFCKLPKSTTSSTLTNCPMSLNDLHPPPFFRMFFFLERWDDGTRILWHQPLAIQNTSVLPTFFAHPKMPVFARAK